MGHRVGAVLPGPFRLLGRELRQGAPLHLAEVAFAQLVFAPGVRPSASHAGCAVSIARPTVDVQIASTPFRGAQSPSCRAWRRPSSVRAMSLTPA